MAKKRTSQPARRSSTRKTSSAKVTKPRVAPAAANDRFAGISSAAVEKATGKAWSQWCRLLDQEGAKKLPHKEIAALVHDKFKVGSWWCQMVTVGYEQAKGLRQAHQTPRGFQVSASKTLGVPLFDLFQAWEHDFLRAAWCDHYFTIRKATLNKSMRITWPDNTNVEVNFYRKGPRKSQVAIQHGKLKSARDVARVKKLWSAALKRLTEFLGG